tara:strand:- start:392 stop:541 length:150 start_codon:yes stop_codon:yes gene_type:complete
VEVQVELFLMEVLVVELEVLEKDEQTQLHLIPTLLYQLQVIQFQFKVIQ